MSFGLSFAGYGKLGAALFNGIVGNVAGAISALFLSQNWDSVTAPALPTGWLYSAGLVTSTSKSVTGTNSLAAPINQAANTVAYYGTADTNNGDVIVVSKVLFPNGNTTQLGGIFARASGATILTNLGTCYNVDITSSGTGRGISLAKFIAGAGTVLSNVASTQIIPGIWYRLILTCLGTSISVKLYNERDGGWLSPAGFWQTAEVATIAITDSSVTGAGFCGVWEFNGTGSEITFKDDFEIYNATATVAPSTALRVSPTNPALASGLANHQGYPFSLWTDGSLAAPLPFTLSDGGVGGRFTVGSVQSFATVSAGTIPVNTQLGNQQVFYFPPYNRTSPVTITVSSPLGGQSITYNVNGYATTGAPTPSTLSFDQVAQPGFANQWSALPLDISGGFAAGLTGYTNILDTNGGVETISGGVYSRLNAALANKIFYKSNTALITNAYNVELQVSAWGGGATDQIYVGVAIDANNYFAAVADNVAGTLKLISVTGGISTTISSTIPISLPAGSKLMFTGGVQYPTTTTSQISLWYLLPGDTQYTLSSFGLANAQSMMLVSTLATMFPFWGTSQAANTAVHVTNFTCGHSGTYVCPLNTAVVKDITTGAPLMSPDLSSIYVVGDVGNGVGAAPNVIYAWNVKTWAFTEVARVIVNDATYTGLGPITMNYNPGTLTWVVMAANWATSYHVATLVPSYATTTADLLSGVNTVTVSPLPLPSTAAAGAGSPVTVYDADILFQGGVYTVVYVITDGGITWTNRTLAMATATSLAGPFTQQWTQTLAGGRYDGARISKVGGTLLAMGSNNITSLNAFNLSTGASLGSFVNATFESLAGNNFITPTGVAPHASLAPIPGEIAGQTRYVFPLFQQSNIDLTGLPKMLTGAGQIWCFEALQRYTSAEFTWITAS